MALQLLFSVQTILVIGSGPIVIGQAAEFDYAGTQACKSLREEGYRVALINSNPATIMTDLETADAVYIEPLTPEFCERVIARERPYGILPTLGGQTGLNLASQIAQRGILEKYGVKLLGTPLEAIQKAEDREQFRTLMREINEPVPESWIIETPEQLKELLPNAPYPCIIRPAYTLGGTGGGIANSPEELWEIGNTGLKLSMRSQVMVERSLLGWKEVEYEVMRDGKGNCITICNMENLDPMGVHTGDSIVVAPSQTLSDIEYHMLRTASLKIIRSLGIEGGCNVQLAVNPESFDYYVIEVNPRVSRSSALASKATGYPIARVSAKIAIGKTLDDIDNQITKTTKACFEPALDYVVVKIPRWPFDKFPGGDRTLFTQMKATGEVMAIDRTFESALLKAIRGLEVKSKDLWHPKFAGSKSGMGVSPMRPEGVPPSVGSELAGIGEVKAFDQVRDAPETHGRDAHATSQIGIDPNAPIEKRKGANLPHWSQDGGIYAVTFRLADALPKAVAEALREERQALQNDNSLKPHERHRLLLLLTSKYDDELDRGTGSCAIGDPQTAKMVCEALEHFDGDRYHLHAYCVMPNHVHVVVEPGSEGLADILHSWKSFTSHRIRKVNGVKNFAWQPEYYDHLIRDLDDYFAQRKYVLDNPAKAGLTESSNCYALSLEEIAARLGAPKSGMGVSPMRPEGVSPSVGLEGAGIGEVKEFYQGRDAPETHGRDAHATGAMPDDQLREAIRIPTDERLWAVAEGLRRGWSVETVNRISRIDPWFLHKIRRIVTGEFREQPERAYKMVDTCAGEFESQTPYFYATDAQAGDELAPPAQIQHEATALA